MWLVKFDSYTKQFLFKTKEEVFAFMNVNKYSDYSLQYIKIYGETIEEESK